MAWTVYKSDSFNRADAGTLGSNYPTGATDFSIVSNQCVIPATGIDKYAMWASPADDFAPYPDQSSSALIFCSSSGTTGEGPGVHVRQKNDGSKEMYRLVADGAGHVELGRFVASSYTPLAQYSAAFVNGSRLTLRVIGSGTATMLETIYNGVSLGTYNDTSGSALDTGQPGISYSSEVIGTNKWDDAEFGIFTTDAAIAPGRVDFLGAL